MQSDYHRQHFTNSSSLGGKKKISPKTNNIEKATVAKVRLGVRHGYVAGDKAGELERGQAVKVLVTSKNKTNQLIFLVLQSFC